MDIEELKGLISNEVIESLKSRNISKLTPPQSLAIKEGLLENKNIVIASPTASGKTLIAELAMLKSILGKGKKAIYVAPMRALAYEKYDEFKLFYPYLKSVISIGDLDSNDLWLSTFELFFFSTEKFDSLMRHGIEWLNDVGCIIFDEVHMLGDSSRGPTLELLMTKISSTLNAQIVALSATIGNALEMANWLNANLIESTYRPIELKKGILYENKVYYFNNEKETFNELNSFNKIPELSLVDDTLLKKKQALIFYSTRRNAESGAQKISEHIKKDIDNDSREKLEKLSNDILNVLERPTDQCIKLSKVVKNGVGFHHAGLVNQQRFKIEEAFKSNLIKVICSTTTLGLGVNIPAHTVLVRDLSRYTGGYGSDKMGVNELMQLFGRAGRPKYDTEGRALIIAKSKSNIKELYDKYINADLESIDSNLGIAPVLRSHILAFISENFLNTEEQIDNFISKTFYGFQYGNTQHIKNVINEILNDLERWGFIELGNGNILKSTKIGKRVSMLYLDPLSARWIIDCLTKEMDDIGILYMISNTLEMRPYMKPTQEAMELQMHYRYLHKDSVLEEYYDIDSGRYDSLAALSTGLMLNEWINESKENTIIEKFKTTPGAIYNKLTLSDWISYSATELAKAIRVPYDNVLRVRIRIKYGIKEELLDLVRLEKIGRVRARTLFNNGIKSIKDIRDNKDKVRMLIGKEISEDVFKQIG